MAYVRGRGMSAELLIVVSNRAPRAGLASL